MNRIRNIKAFTLVELMVTLVITGIILSAVATLAYAMNSASQTGNEVALTQAQLRLGTLRVLDVIQNCRMVLTASDTELAIWRSDYNEDGHINVNELVFLDCTATHDTLRLVWSSSASNPEVTFSGGSLSVSQADVMNCYEGVCLPLLPECNNVQFVCDVAAPSTRRVTISFELTQEGVAHEYEIDATLRAWAGHLLNDAADGLMTEDDDE
jgi:prepilin-type N-terminal cleavage/methylation domain-containing protein